MPPAATDTFAAPDKGFEAPLEIMLGADSRRFLSRVALGLGVTLLIVAVMVFQGIVIDRGVVTVAIVLAGLVTALGIFADLRRADRLVIDGPGLRGEAIGAHGVAWGTVERAVVRRAGDRLLVGFELHPVVAGDDKVTHGETFQGKAQPHIVVELPASREDAVAAIARRVRVDRLD